MDWINTWPIVQKDTGEFGFQPSVQAARNVQDLLNDPVLCNLRKQLKKNIEPPTCERCFYVEKQGGFSYRMDANETHKDKIHEESINEEGVLDDTTKITYLDLTLGNVCNLKCKTCNPWSSHNWID